MIPRNEFNTLFDLYEQELIEALQSAALVNNTLYDELKVPVAQEFEFEPHHKWPCKAKVTYRTLNEQESNVWWFSLNPYAHYEPINYLAEQMVKRFHELKPEARWFNHHTAYQLYIRLYHWLRQISIHDIETWLSTAVYAPQVDIGHLIKQSPDDSLRTLTRQRSDLELQILLGWLKDPLFKAFLIHYFDIQNDDCLIHPLEETVRNNPDWKPNLLEQEQNLRKNFESFKTQQLKYLQSKHPHWNVKVLLHGLSFETESHSDTNNLILRPPIFEDFIRVISKSELYHMPGASAFVIDPHIELEQNLNTEIPARYRARPLFDLMDVLSENYDANHSEKVRFGSSCVLEMTLTASEHQEVLKKTESLLHSLSLFSVHSVELDLVNAELLTYPEQEGHTALSLMNKWITPAFFKLHLCPQTLIKTDFWGFVDHVWNQLQALPDSARFITLALERYHEALSLPPEKELEQRLFLAIAALESLYKPTEKIRQTLMRRLKMAVLDLTDLQDEAFDELFDQLYKHRCNYAHGNLSQPLSQRELLHLCLWALELTRLSILVYLECEISSNDQRDIWLKTFDDQPRTQDLKYSGLPFEQTQVLDKNTQQYIPWGDFT